MRKLQTFFLTAAAILLAASLSAQETSKKYPSEGNWFADCGLGINTIYNNGHVGGAGLAIEAAAGKWLSPDVALRAGLHGLYNSPYKDDTEWFTGEGPFMPISLTADVLWDPFSTFKGYNSERFYSLQPYGRFSFISVCKDFKPQNMELGAGGGLKNVFRLNQSVAAYLDLAAVISREQAYRPDGRFILFPTATIGLSFRIGKQGFPKKEKETVIQECDHLPQIHNLLARIEELKKAPADTVRVVEYVEKKVEVPATEDLVIGSVIVFFDKGSDVLSVEERARLEAFAKSEAVKDAQIIITGSADSATGSAELNKALSEKRAGHVLDLLVSRFGVNKSKVSVEAIGDTANVGSPEDNRCVTVTASKMK